LLKQSIDITTGLPVPVFNPTKKRVREELEDEKVKINIGELFMRDRVTWGKQKGQVCTTCAKSDQNCYWTDTKQARACFACSKVKRTCSRGGVLQEGSEVSPSKKKKTDVEVRKGKERNVREADSAVGMGIGSGGCMGGDLGGVEEEEGDE
jgi:hypothetical protein